MVKIESKNNYLFVTLADGNIYSGLATNFEFQQESTEDTFDVLFKNNLIADGVIYSDFTDETETPFASVEAFKDYYTLVSGIISESLTNAELRATAIDVNVTNQIDLTAIETTLNDVLTSLQNIETNTDGVEALIQDTIDEITANGTLNNSNLQSVISELQGLDVNTDEIETLIDDVLNVSGLNAKETTLSAMSSKLPSSLGQKTKANSLAVTIANDQDNLTTSTTTVITSTTTNQIALDSNSDRKELWIENVSNQRIYIKFGGVSTSTNYTLSLGQNEKSPKTCYKGAINIINGAGSSTVVITEVTP